MMNYDRRGIDYSIKAKPRVRYADKDKKKFDWVNAILLIFLFIVIVLFVIK